MWPDGAGAPLQLESFPPCHYPHLPVLLLISAHRELPAKSVTSEPSRECHAVQPHDTCTAHSSPAKRPDLLAQVHQLSSSPLLQSHPLSSDAE